MHKGAIHFFVKIHVLRTSERACSSMALNLSYCGSVFREGDVIFINSDFVMLGACFGDLELRGPCVIGYVLDFVRAKTPFSSYYKPRLELEVVPLVNQIVAAPLWCNEVLGLLVNNAWASCEDSANKHVSA